MYVYIYSKLKFLGAIYVYLTKLIFSDFGKHLKTEYEITYMYHLSSTN